MPNQDASFLNPDRIIAQIGLQSGSYVGDLGCGSGYMSFAASRAVGPKGRVYAIDVQKAVLEQVKKEARVEGITNIITLWSDLEVSGATQITDASLDAVLLVNILFLVKGKVAVFKEAQRLLKREGILLVVDWFPGSTGIGPTPASRVGSDQALQLAQSAGFAKQADIDAGKFHYGMVYKQQ